jgi:hypothetical protein
MQNIPGRGIYMPSDPEAVETIEFGRLASELANVCA